MVKRLTKTFFSSGDSRPTNVREEGIWKEAKPPVFLSMPASRYGANLGPSTNSKQLALLINDNRSLPIANVVIITQGTPRVDCLAGVHPSFFSFILKDQLLEKE